MSLSRQGMEMYIVIPLFVFAKKKLLLFAFSLSLQYFFSETAGKIGEKSY